MKDCFSPLFFNSDYIVSLPSDEELGGQAGY